MVSVLQWQHEQEASIMNYQTVFKRYELKYLLTQAQRAQLLRAMSPYMALDSFGHSTIRNIYFDTDSYRLARRSIEQPAYKEKLRLRGYGEGDGDSTAFVELKKKYDSVVYKRRLSLPEGELSAAQIRAVVKQVRRERMAQDVRR